MDDGADIDETKKRLGQRLRELRETRGWRQVDLAEATGFTLRTIGSWEREGPPPSKVRLLDRVLRGELLRGELLRNESPQEGPSNTVSTVMDDGATNDRVQHDRTQPHDAFGPIEALLDEILHRLDAIEHALRAPAVPRIGVPAGSAR